MPVSLQYLKTLNFGLPALHDGTLTEVQTAAADLAGFVGNVYIVVNAVPIDLLQITIVSVELQDSPTGNDPFTNVVGGEFVGRVPESIDTFQGTLVIPVERLQRFIRVNITTTGEATPPNVLIIDTIGVALPQYAVDDVKYAPEE
jgi:hypothetical protein